MVLTYQYVRKKAIELMEIHLRFQIYIKQRYYV